MIGGVTDYMSNWKKIVIIICMIVVIPLSISMYFEEKEPKTIEELFQNDLNSAGYEFEETYVLNEFYDDRYVYLVSDSEDYFVLGQTQLSNPSVFSDYLHMYYEDAFVKPCFYFDLYKHSDVLVIGFVKDKNIDKVEYNGKENKVKYYTMPSGKEFGFWYDFVDKDYKNNLNVNYIVVS